jgi:EAL domain-containing protein (putative c-di-GMP-specific phosphodiesterase class I)/DNA-binding response OmpR family regulator
MLDRRILIVDDDEDVLLIVQTLLHNAGYAVSAARSGHEALEMAQALKPELVLLDVGMPEMSGWQVCAALRGRPETASTPIAMLTVKSEIRDLITGMQVGADDYVTKPFTKRRLLETVERLLEGRTRDRADLLPKGASDLRAATLLFDPVTGLPTIPVLIDALREWLLVDHEVGVLSVDVERFSYVEQFFGWEVFDELLREVARALRRTLGVALSTEDLLAQGSPAAGEFYVFVAFPPGVGGSAGLEGLASKARALEEALRHELSERFRHRLHREIVLHVGVAKVVYSPQVRLERIVYSALREAARTAASRAGEEAARQREEFRDVLLRGRIATVYQPIVDLRTGRVVAHEALSRGPADTEFASPEALFEYALRTDEVWSLEKICIGSAAERFRGLAEGMLFVNVETSLVHELKVRGHEVLAPLLALGGNVVLEITERAAIRDFALFRESVSVLRQLGFEVALDDAGSGFASLQAIAELRPAYIKISNTLVTGLAHDAIKRDVVEMLVRLADRIEARTVAEGIETEDDLAELRKIGVEFGQGYLLGRPAPLRASG